MAMQARQHFGSKVKSMQGNAPKSNKRNDRKELGHEWMNVAHVSQRPWCTSVGWDGCQDPNQLWAVSEMKPQMVRRICSVFTFPNEMVRGICRTVSASVPDGPARGLDGTMNPDGPPVERMET